MKLRAFFDRYILWIVGAVLLIALVVPSAKRYFAGPIPDDGIAWRTDLAAAMAEAKTANKLLLLDFSASWCPPCQIMKRESWPNPRVRELIEQKYVPVFLDIDTPAGKEASASYNVEVVPTLIVLSPAAAPLRQANFLSRDDLVDFLAK